jgi:hypothetical protein
MPYIDPSVIEQVKRIDLLTYLKEYEPDELIRLGNGTYTIKEHDSLKISNGRWFWWSQGAGGRSALDFLIKVRGMMFLDAVTQLGAFGSVPMSRPAERKNAGQPERRFVLPSPMADNTAAVTYLASRGIAACVIERSLEDGLVYASKRGSATNVVFVGYDADAHPRYAALRGVSSDFKGEVSGSDKRFSFRLAAATPKGSVHVFEGAIDVLSYATLALQSGVDYRVMNLLSLGGISQIDARTDKDVGIPRALAQYFRDNFGTRHVYLHLDNDEPGTRAADATAASLRSRGLGVTIAPPPANKDVNEYLVSRNQQHPLQTSIKTGNTGRTKTTAKKEQPKGRW